MICSRLKFQESNLLNYWVHHATYFSDICRTTSLNVTNDIAMPLLKNINIEEYLLYPDSRHGFARCRMYINSYNEWINWKTKNLSCMQYVPEWITFKGRFSMLWPTWKFQLSLIRTDICMSATNCNMNYHIKFQVYQLEMKYWRIKIMGGVKE